ncbi:hypothetical protein [Actinacidiphila guanduensis]|uniref:Uncharacterized protein n=1 Tax=Actinacidiphila guanduensis TaxID=310781 RepID=A0A1H0RSC8_9ACTN|nr:hypothetical protein [Actinacidiphila guanduensis]SDP31878.1 hypothetical protein SAMN05216259_12366 [Actinacidiphila guanduensis]
MTAPEPNAPPLHAALTRHDRAAGRLRDFSDALAHRLPGSWNAATKAPFAYSPTYADAMDRLWDHNHVEWALLNFAQEEAALLDGPDKELLIVLPRPRRPGQFLVAALAPPGLTGTLHLHHAPDGIAVPADPARAAAAIERRFLPRYRQAVATVRGPALEEAHLLAQEALAEWDAISDSLCDEHGVPLDEDAYGARQVQRDAEAWTPFETFLFHGPAAIHDAQAALTTLTFPATTTGRWSHQLRELNGALAEGTRIRDDWDTYLADILNHRTGPGRWRAFNNALETRNAEAWHAITTFIDFTPVLHAIHDAERQQAQERKVSAARAAAARARSTTAAATPKRGTRLPTHAAPTPPSWLPAPPHTPGR